MSTSQIFGAIDALVAIAQTQYAGLEVDVIDGPIDAQPARDYLLVGAEEPRNTSGSPILASEGGSDWVGLGALHRDETFTIHCVYVAFSGDPALTTSRARAKTNIGLLENALRTSNGIILNGAVNQPGWVGLIITHLGQVKPGNGCEAHVHFGVHCRGRI